MEQMNPPRTRHPGSGLRAGIGFTLVELLVVMAVILVLLGAIVPALRSLSQGNNLNLAGENLSSAIMAARDAAMTNNRKVSVRLLQGTDAGDGNTHYRAVQLWIVKDDAGTTIPLGAISRFPAAIVLSEATGLSPLVQSPPAQTGSMTVAGVSTNYASFPFTANGAPDGSVTSANSYLTLVRLQDVAAAKPANFLALFINPVTGEVTTYRP